MRLTLFSFILAIALSSACLGQEWELGGVGGYGWYYNPTIRNPATSGRGGFPPRAALGVVLTENLYEYISGEFRYLFRFGGPQLQANGITESAHGYTNAITYDIVFHMRPRESNLRPFISTGAGIKVYTASGIREEPQPLIGLALLTPVTQVEPAIGVGGGLKYMLHKNVQLRLDIRTYLTPLPNEVIRPRGTSVVHGWIYDFVPLAGISYVF